MRRKPAFATAGSLCMSRWRASPAEFTHEKQKAERNTGSGTRILIGAETGGRIQTKAHGCRAGSATSAILRLRPASFSGADPKGAMPHSRAASLRDARRPRDCAASFDRPPPPEAQRVLVGAEGNRPTHGKMLTSLNRITPASGNPPRESPAAGLAISGRLRAAQGSVPALAAAGLRFAAGRSDRDILGGWHHKGTCVSGRTDRISERGIGAAANLTATSVAGRRGDGARIAAHDWVVVDQRE